MLDRQTLERHYRQMEKPLYNVALRWTWNEAEARELVQETFVRVWARRLFVDVETSSSYLYRTLLNLCQSHARRRVRWRRVHAVLTAAPAAAPTPEQVGDRARLRDAIESLSDDLRHVLLLSEYTDLKQREIAKLLAIPPGTVASRRHAAIRRLKEMFDEPDRSA